MKILRPYQKSAGESLWDWLLTKRGNPLLVAPVGAGKSLMIADFVREAHERFPRTRIVKLTHNMELLEQNMAEMMSQYPSADAGYYCAALGQKKLHNDITFASIQSVGKKITSFNRAPEIILIDECHLISHNEATLYRTFIDAAMALNPNCRVIGFTGTPYRSDTGRLDEGEGKLFDGVAYEIPIAWMIEQGYLVRPVTPGIENGIDANGVGKRGGDFVPSQLQKHVLEQNITEKVVSEVISNAAISAANGVLRRRWFGMTAGVEHCQEVLNEFVKRGYACRMVTGDTDKEERRATIAWFKEDTDDVRILLNVGTLNVGFNAPNIDLLFPMRPTRSPVLYMQYTGRGLRPVYAPRFDLETQAGRLASIAASPKPNVLFLDFGGIIAALGPIDALDIRQPYKKKDEEEEVGAPIMKRCPACGSKCYAAQKSCYECSYSFAANSVESQVSEKALLAADEPPVWHGVVGVTYEFNQKEGKLPNLKVCYATLSGRFYEYVCFQHADGSFPHNRARLWHQQRVSFGDMPATVAEALELGERGVYSAPGKILVGRQKDNPKYFEVKRADFVFEDPAPVRAKTVEELLDDEIPF